VTRPAPRIALIAALALLLSATGALAAAPKVSLTAVEMQYMCTSCHEPLAMVESPQAQSEKQYLRGLIGQGLNARQIQHQMVAQYGLSVLAKPPARGFNLTVYILPPAILVIGIAGLIYTLPKWRARARRAAAEHPQGAPPLAPGDAKRLDDDLTRFI
jgi:cytochrome c-type biogenesis protein CcmH